MPYDPQTHRRRTIRLRRYDYAGIGAYFITVCTAGRHHLFGEIADDGIRRISSLGEIVQDEWHRTAQVRPSVRLDPAEFVVMPNHVHGIVWITGCDGDGIVAADGIALDHGGRAHSCAPLPSGIGWARGDALAFDLSGDTGCRLYRTPRSLGTLVAGFKATATARINRHRKTPGVPVWQRNYHEHIIRDAESLQRIRQYIIDNPRRWHQDRLNQR